MPETRRDPFVNFRFLVEIDQVSAGAFKSASGLKSETEVFEYHEGGDNLAVRKLVGQSKVTNITLKKGYVASAALWNWRKEVAQAGEPIRRRNGSIVLLSDSGEEISRWNFFDAWPVSWEASPFDAGSSEVFVETLELACERIEAGK